MVEYSFYFESYKGVSIAQEDWPVYEAQATAQLSRYKRIYTVSAPDENAESMAICSMADTFAYIAAVQNGAGGQIASASIGSVSTSYASGQGVDISDAGQSRELYRAASMYLDIYRGVPSC